MKHLARVVAAAALFCLASIPARADVSPAEASAYVKGLISAAGLDDVFEDGTWGTSPVARHRASGVICLFDHRDVNPRGDRVYLIDSGLPRGDDAACGIHNGEITTSVFVTRFPTTPTLETAMDGYYREVIRDHPDWKRYQGQGVQLQAPPDKPLPRKLTSTFVYNELGRQVFSHLSVSIVNGWVIEIRVTAPLDQAVAADLQAEVSMFMAQQGALHQLPNDKP